MTENPVGLQVGIAYWQYNEDMGNYISRILGARGNTVIPFLYYEKLPQDLDVVITYGPFGSLVPIANQLLNCPPSRRPAFILWMTEQLPNQAIPQWMRYTIGMFRSKLERFAFNQETNGNWKVKARMAWLTTRAYRYRYYGDLVWLHRKKILSILAVGSQWIHDLLKQEGFDSNLAYYGYFPDMGKDLNLERDIPVLWLGKKGSGRRGKILNRLRTELKEREIEITVVDGVENQYVYGEKRTVLLNRTKIVLNILRQKSDNHSIRYYLASANGAMIISEPTYRHIPFLPGKHFCEVPVEQIADKVCYYLSHEDERRQIAANAHHLVTTELKFEASLQKIFNQIHMIRREGKAI